jgi:hypothetical protein
MGVISFSGDAELACIFQLSKPFASFTRNDLFFKVMCSFLRDRGVYVPTLLPASESSWRSFYLELRGTRWGTQSSSPATSLALSEPIVYTSQKASSRRFKVNVYARFRPFQEKEKEKEKDSSLSSMTNDGSANRAGAALDENNDYRRNTAECVLPLHQRIRLIRMNSASTRREALRMLASEGEWFGKKWENILTAGAGDATANDSGSKPTGEGEEDVRLADCETVALLPFEKSLHVVRKERRERVEARVQSVDTGSGRVVMVAPDVGLREFSFNGVVTGTARGGLSAARKQQDQCYNLFARRLVVDFLNGYNATCIAYGQTASGKTYTMTGGESDTGSSIPGIIPKACAEALEFVLDTDGVRARLGITCSLSISYVEVYGDLVSDLLRGGVRVGHSKVASQSFVLSGTVETPVVSLEDVTAALRTGDDQRRRAATAMNDRSSRAHGLVILTLHQTRARTGETRSSRLFLADLGGSEKVEKSRVDAGVSRRTGEQAQFSQGFQLGQHMREAVHINLGLLALKRCIEALNEEARYVPYQDSKLTMLLSTGLGGDCKTSVIVCSSLDPQHSTETLSTLRFGERCSLVENDARNGASVIAGMLAALDMEISSLEKVIVAKERWVHQDIKRVDTNAERGTFEAQGMGGVETKKISYLTGAEDERRQLSALLARKRAFTGHGGRELDESGVAAVGQGQDQSQGADKENVPRVLAFGKVGAQGYGLGQAFDENADAAAENRRFHEALSAEELSAVVRRKGAKRWTTASDLERDPRKLEDMAKRAPRSKLVYSGISA